MKKLFYILFFLLLLPSFSLAQTKNVNKGNQQWVQYYFQGKINEEWSWLTDAGFRWKDWWDNPTQYFVRTGIGYHLHPDVRVLAGAAYIRLHTGDDWQRNEWRVYQELTLKQGYEKVQLQHRFRSEQRWVRHLATGASSFNWRLRYRFTVTAPIVTLSPQYPDRKLLISVGDEVLVNAGKEIVHNLLDQNRFLIGGVLQWQKNLAFTLTYHHNFKERNVVNSYDRTGILWLGIKHKLNFTKKT